MKHLWVFCFAADGFQTWVSQGFSRMTWGSCIWVHESLWFSVLRCPDPGAAAGVWTWPGEALTHPVLHMCYLWLLHQHS
jgi:hypothetical protein